LLSPGTIKAGVDVLLADALVTLSCEIVSPDDCKVIVLLLVGGNENVERKFESSGVAEGTVDWLFSDVLATRPLEDWIVM
jgi:hypothetical protein